MIKKYLVAIMVFFLLFSMVVGFFSISEVKGIRFSDGDIHYYINDSFSFSEDIILEGNTTLVIENATVEFVQTTHNQYGIELKSTITGSPYLKIKNATFKSSKRFKFSLFGASRADVEMLKFEGVGGKRSAVKLYENASFSAFDSKVPSLYCYDFASLKIISTDSNYIYTYDHSYAEILSSEIYYIKAYGSSNVNISLSDVLSSITAVDNSLVSCSISSLIGKATSQENSTILLVECDVYQFKLTVQDYGNVTLQDVTSTPSKYPGEFEIYDESRVSLISSKLNDMILKVKGNSSLKVMSSYVTSSVFYFYDFSEVEFKNSKIDWIVESLNKSTVNAVNSTFNILSVEESSNVSLDRSDVGRLRCYESSRALLLNSHVKDVMVELYSVNLTFNNFREGYLEELSFVLAGGLNVTFVETTIEAGWSFRLLGYSNVSFYDSKIANLHCADNSKVYLQNTTYVSVDAIDYAEVEVWAYLTVQTVDYFGSSVKGAEVRVTHSTTGSSGVTDEDGKVVFKLFERFVNASGEFYSGNYEVNVTYDGVTYNYDVELAGSKTIVCLVASPWWYWYAIYGGAIAFALVVIGVFGFWYFKRRR